MEVDIHFIHIWGIEFLLNLGVMYLVSLKSPPKAITAIPQGPLNLQEWKFAKPLSIVLCVVTVMIYWLLGR
jgi:solute:Na+ symporter, SSS family